MQTSYSILPYASKYNFMSSFDLGLKVLANF